MEITLNNVGRRFNREWIFRGISQTFHENKSYAILGANGMGKSTLLQVIAGSLASSEGTVSYKDAGRDYDSEQFFDHISMAAPYMELIEDFSFAEVINFHFKFKPYIAGLNAAAVIELLSLHTREDKLIKYFSSGMKQRLKLALAFCSATPILMLDEPTANLDTQGIDWYLSLVERFTANRLSFVCSNQIHEYEFCDNRLIISDYKN